MSAAWMLSVLRWLRRGVLLAALLLVIAGAILWWWTGREGSLDWALRRFAASQAIRIEGVHGALRGSWQLDHLAWEHGGLRIEVDNLRMAWQPLGLVGRRVQLEGLSAAAVRIEDQRPASPGPLVQPESLRLPWPVRIDMLQVGRLKYTGRVDVEASGLAARYDFDGTRHALWLEDLRLAGGVYHGSANVQARRPQQMDVQLAGRFAAPLPGSNAKLPLQFEASLQGPLDRIAASAVLRAIGIDNPTLPHATLTAVVTPFESAPLPEAAADLRQLDAAQFWPGAPRTLLSGRVMLRPAAPGAWNLQADLRNALAGPWDAGRLPVERATGEGEWRDGTALVKTLQARVAGGTVAGNGVWEGQGWRFRGNVAGLDPAQVHTALSAVPVSGAVQLQGSGQRIAFDVDLRADRAPPPHAGALHAAVEALRTAQAQGQWDDGTLALQKLQVRTDDASVEGQFELAWHARSGKGELRLQAPGLQAQASGALAERQGQGHVELQLQDVAHAVAWLRQWPVVGPRLAGLDLRGQGEAQASWQGGWADPALQARVHVTSLAWQPHASGGAQAPLPWVLEQGELHLDGRSRDATLQVQLKAAQGQRTVQWTASSHGGRDAGGAWHGQLATFALQAEDPALAAGRWQLEVHGAPDWRYAKDAFSLTAGEAVLQAPPLPGGAPATQAQVSWSPLQVREGELHTAGRVKGLPLAWIELVGGPQLVGAARAGDLVFDAQWDAELGSTVRLNASLARARGDLALFSEQAQGGATQVTAGVREARLTLTSQGPEVTLDLLWDSERAGHAHGQLRTSLAHTAQGGWEWPEHAPIAGRVQADLPRIAVWSLLAPPGWRLRGSLSADIAITGTRAQPQLSGPLTAEELALRSVVDGVELGEGELRAQLQGQRLVVSEFLLHGSAEGGGNGGSLRASGSGEWTPNGPLLSVRAELTRLRASVREDRQLTLSGTATARVDHEGLDVTGQLRVDQARITIPEESPPRLGDDVVVRNAPDIPSTEAERSLRPTPSEGGRTMTVKVSVDLGDDFHIKGRGLDSRLAGQVDVEGRTPQQPQVTGSIRAVGGTFAAYGQQLRIERGMLRFTGPADNPALDILAVRSDVGQTQRVGVQVSGRALAPHIELYSDPALSDADALSWLVLGQASSGGGAQTLMLQRAAAALLAGRTGGDSSKSIASHFGLDEFSFRQDSTTTSTGTTSGSVVRVGKRFANNFYAAYERSLASAAGTLFLFYDVSRRLTVRAEAGERAGLDLIFTFTYDRVGR